MGSSGWRASTHIRPTRRKQVERVNADNGREMWFRADELARVRDCCLAADGIPDDYRQPLADTVTFASTTGIRFDNVCGFCRADYREDSNGNAYRYIERDKNGRPLHKMLEGPLRELVERRVEADVPHAPALNGEQRFERGHPAP